MNPYALEVLGRQHREALDAEAARGALAASCRRSPRRSRAGRRLWAFAMTVAAALERTGSALEQLARSHGVEGPSAT